MSKASFLDVWKKIFGNWKYLVLAVVVAVLFYSFNVLIVNWRNLASFYDSFGVLGTLKFFITLSLGFGALIKMHSFISLIIISVMFGMLISMVGFKVKNNLNMRGGKRQGVLGGIGIFLAAFAPGCAACGIGLASALGISTAFLTFLPYEGLELSILSIAIMGFVIYKFSKDFTKSDVCKVNLEIISSKDSL